MEFRTENPEYRYRQMVRLKVERDGYYRDDEMEARVCADPDCKAVSYAYGNDQLGSGAQNRADVRCSKHDG